MRVGIFGGLGSIGSRYTHILRWLDHEPIVIDAAVQESMDRSWEDIERFIICTPTDTHLDLCKTLIDKGKIFLCEKPLSKDLEGIKAIKDYEDGYCINNYAWTFKHKGIVVDTINYDYWRTGKDGLLWDVCQLLYLDPKAKIANESPVFDLTVNGTNPIDIRDVEWGYVQMLHWFTNCDECDHGLWSLEEGYRMSKTVLERMERERLRTDSGA